MDPFAATLDDGIVVTVRRAASADGPAIARMHRRCSLDTVFRRYLTAMPSLSPSLQQRLLELHLTVVAVHGREVIGLAHLAESPDGPPELALMVEDGWQRRGVGRLLAETVLRAAEADGHETAVACTLPSSTAVHVLLRRLRRGRLAPEFHRGEDGLVRVALHLEPRRGSLPRGASLRALSA
jgi:GNAT superfamily N-acetyltransferase